jgi:replicative DNA helicase
MSSERVLIGAILTNNQAMDNVDLKPHHFERYGELFGYLQDQISKGRTVDPVSVSQGLAHTEMGNEYDLRELTRIVFDACPMSSIQRHAEIIREGYGKRLIRQVCISAVNQTEDGSSFEETVNYISASLLDMEIQNRKGAQELNTVLSGYMDVIQTRLEGGGKKLNSGLTDLNELLGGGFEAGQLVIVAGRPGMGKSAFSLGLATSAKDPVLIVNMEMENMQTAERFVANVGSAHLGWLRNPTEDSENWGRMTYAIQRLAEKENTIFLDDCPSQSLFSIRAEARRIQRKHGLGCVIVDYLSLMEGSDAKERHNQVAEFSRGLKRLAKELNVPVVALAQLSRKVEERADKRPIMSDLRESGQIEQDADIIIFLYREEQYNQHTDWKGIAELIVAKQRQGDTGTVRCEYKGQYTRFQDLPLGWIAPAPQEQQKGGRNRG